MLVHVRGVFLGARTCAVAGVLGSFCVGLRVCIGPSWSSWNRFIVAPGPLRRGPVVELVGPSLRLAADRRVQ